MIEKLCDVRMHRRPFVNLTKRLLAEALEKPLGSAQRIVEIGAGDGQLRELLPGPLHANLLHTEPLALGVQRFAERHPDANVVRASAERLPLADAEADAAIALCVMDVVDDGLRIARELARVLKPGGIFVHLLDMSVDPTAALRHIHATRSVAFPNLFSDPCEAAWPEDLFIAPRAEIEQIAAVLRAAQHPFAAFLGKYLAMYQATPFSAPRAAAAYNELSESGTLKVGLMEMFRAANRLASPTQKQAFARFRGQPVSSLRFFDARLKRWFNETTGFRIEHSDLAVAAEVVPRTDSSVGYRSIAAGHVRELEQRPKFLLNEPAPEASDADMLVEQSLYVFVVRRV